MKITGCDNCQREIKTDRFGYPDDVDHLTIEVNAYDVTESIDACSWACVADLALKRAADKVTTGEDA